MYEIYSHFGRLLGTSHSLMDAEMLLAGWKDASFVVYRDAHRCFIALTK